MSPGRLAVAVLLVTLCGRPAEADPITYTIIFTGGANGTLLPASGSFEYDSATGTFADFQVMWNGASFDLTAAANSPLLGGAGASAGSPGTGAMTFAMLSGLPSTPCGGWDSSWTGSWNDANNTGQFGFLAWTAAGCEEESIGFGALAGTDGAALDGVSGGSGQWLIAPVLVPSSDPSLLLLGIGLVGLRAWRRRIG